MFVAICDDEELFRKEIKDFLVKYKYSRRICLDIMEFSNGTDLLNCTEKFDIIFLDYEMPGLDGLKTAQLLRARKNLCCIIYVTSYPEYVFQSFEVGTYRYLVKPLDKVKLAEAIDSFIKDKKMLCPVVLNIDGEQLIINSEDIVYLEADGKFCNIRTNTNYFHSSKTISKVYELLPQHCFFRTHKSYAVNLYCITSIKNDIITLNNGEQVKISRNNLADFKKAYKEFIKYFVARN